MGRLAQPDHEDTTFSAGAAAAEFIAQILAIALNSTRRHALCPAANHEKAGRHVSARCFAAAVYPPGG